MKQVNPDSKIHGDNMGPTWVLSSPGGRHVGPMNLAIWESVIVCTSFPQRHLSTYEIPEWEDQRVHTVAVPYFQHVFAATIRVFYGNCRESNGDPVTVS